MVRFRAIPIARPASKTTLGRGRQWPDSRLARRLGSGAGGGAEELSGVQSGRALVALSSAGRRVDHSSGVSSATTAAASPSPLSTIWRTVEVGPHTSATWLKLRDVRPTDFRYRTNSS